MLDKINTRKKEENFEEKIVGIYNKYEKIKIDDQYIELWNGFVDLIEYVQQLSNESNLSPLEAIDLMRELGMTNEDFKQLLMTSIQNDKQ
ncbi:MAG: hypothetical protein HFG16_06160 [Erysipelotrichaceae bacterium]|jgi:hypothetical protein|nr:hypothetical protein [Erysipelotrichaceae bacterium]